MTRALRNSKGFSIEGETFHSPSRTPAILYTSYTACNFLGGDSHSNSSRESSGIFEDLDSWFEQEEEPNYNNTNPLEDIREAPLSPQTTQEQKNSPSSKTFEKPESWFEKSKKASPAVPQFKGSVTSASSNFPPKGTSISSRHYSLEKKLMQSIAPPLPPRHYSLENIHAIKRITRDSGFDTASSPAHQEFQDEYIAMQPSLSAISIQDSFNKSGSAVLTGAFREDSVTNLTKLKSAKSMELLTSDVIDKIAEFSLSCECDESHKDTPSPVQQNLAASSGHIYDNPVVLQSKQLSHGPSLRHAPINEEPANKGPPKIPSRFSSLDAESVVPDQVLYHQGKRLSLLLNQGEPSTSAKQSKSKIKSALNKVIKARKTSLPAINFNNNNNKTKPQSTLAVPNVPRKKLSVDMISAPIITKCPSMEVIAPTSEPSCEDKGFHLSIPSGGISDRQRSKSLVQLQDDSEYVAMLPQWQKISSDCFSSSDNVTSDQNESEEYINAESIDSKTIGVVPPSPPPFPPHSSPNSDTSLLDSCLERRIIIPPFQTANSESSTIYVNEPMQVDTSSKSHLLQSHSPPHAPPHHKLPPQESSRRPSLPPRLQLPQKPQPHHVLPPHHHKLPIPIPKSNTLPQPPLPISPPSLPSLPPPPPPPSSNQPQVPHSTSNALPILQDEKPERTRKKPILPPSISTLENSGRIRAEHVHKKHSNVEPPQCNDERMIDVSQLMSAKDKLKKPPPRVPPHAKKPASHKISVLQPPSCDQSKTTEKLRKVSQPLLSFEGAEYDNLSLRKSQSSHDLVSL